MARERIVSRTIEVLDVVTMTVNVTTSTVENKTLELTGIGNVSNDKVLALLKKQYETDTLKIVSIVSTNKREELYGMLEIDFLKYAHRLDPQTRKVLSIEPTETTDEMSTYEFPSDEETDAPAEDAPVAPKKSKKGGRK